MRMKCTKPMDCLHSQTQNNICEQYYLDQVFTHHECLKLFLQLVMISHSWRVTDFSVCILHPLVELLHSTEQLMELLPGVLELVLPLSAACMQCLQSVEQLSDSVVKLASRKRRKRGIFRVRLLRRRQRCC